MTGVCLGASFMMAEMFRLLLSMLLSSMIILSTPLAVSSVLACGILFICTTLGAINFLQMLLETIKGRDNYFSSDVVYRNEVEIKEQPKPSPKPFIDYAGLFFKPYQKNKPHEVKIDVIPDSKPNAPTTPTLK